jgi:ubiquinone/menaquinone biosynthesis C-methylase UbiE
MMLSQIETACIVTEDLCCPAGLLNFFSHRDKITGRMLTLLKHPLNIKDMVMQNDWNVGELLNVSSGYWKGCALQAAVRLDIFSHIGDVALSCDEVADLARTDNRATEMLLDALAALQLLKKTDFCYSNTSFATTHLCSQSPQYMGHIILHHHHILDGWAQLDTVVRNGKPAQKRSYGEETERQSFIMGMFNLAMGIAPELAKQIDLRNRKNLLDLGGGPGTYAIHFCRTYPTLKATVLDRPTTRPFAEKTIKSFGLEKRIGFIAGDFTTDQISGGPYDAAWLSHILHSNSSEDCYTIIEKVVKEMSPGGIILIHDFILEDSRDTPEFAALFSLNMLINNPRGRSYSESEIRAMLKAAGIKAIERHGYRGPNDSAILFGVV